MTVLTKFEFVSAGNRTKWDWAVLTDGKIRKLEKGKDYDAKYAAAQIRVYAKQHNLTVKVSGGNPTDDHVVLQFIKPTNQASKKTKKIETPVDVENLVNEIVEATK
jgi:hypothetical protein